MATFRSLWRPLRSFKAKKGMLEAEQIWGRAERVNRRWRWGEWWGSLLFQLCGKECCGDVTAAGGSMPTDDTIPGPAGSAPFQPKSSLNPVNLLLHPDFSFLTCRQSRVAFHRFLFPHLAGKTKMNKREKNKQDSQETVKEDLGLYLLEAKVYDYEIILTNCKWSDSDMHIF